jgi:hypothetical protein
MLVKGGRRQAAAAGKARPARTGSGRGTQPSHLWSKPQTLEMVWRAGEIPENGKAGSPSIEASAATAAGAMYRCKWRGSTSRCVPKSHLEHPASFARASCSTHHWFGLSFNSERLCQELDRPSSWRSAWAEVVSTPFQQPPIRPRSASSQRFGGPLWLSTFSKTRRSGQLEQQRIAAAGHDGCRRRPHGQHAHVRHLPAEVGCASTVRLPPAAVDGWAASLPSGLA